MRALTENRLAHLLDWAAQAVWRRVVLTGIVAMIAILPGLGPMPVTDRDEARFAQATKQMLETGDYIDIRFQDQPRWKKPVGIYWLQALSVSTFGGAGAPIWTYRVPSTLAVFLASLALGWAARPLIGPRGAVVAGLMLATTLLAVAEAHIAKTDAALMLTAVLGLGALAHLRAGGGGALWLVFWLAMAAAILLKGPIVPLIAALALGAGWLTRTGPALRALRPLPGLALTAVLVLPWLIAIWVISDGAFFAESVGKDMLGKVAEGKEKHWGPPGLYLALVWLTLWPWAALLPVAVPMLWRIRRTAWVILLAGWVVPFWVILELVPTKLPHYVLPLYPALLIALAWSVTEPADPARWQRWAGALLVAVPVAIVAAAILVGVPVLASGLVEPGLTGAVRPAAMVLALIALGAGILAARAALADEPLRQGLASVVAALALYPALLHVQIPAIAQAFPSPRMAAAWERLAPCADGPLISLGYREPSLAFHAGTATRMLSPWAIAEAWEAHPDAVFLLESRYLDGMVERSPAFFDQMVQRAEVAWYFNYNRGKGTSALVYTSDDARWTACAG